MQPWTTRRLPAALNPGAARRRAAHARDRRTTPVSRPVSGLTKTPLHLPGRDASSGWPRMPSGTRRSRRRTACAMPSLTVAGAAQVGEPRCGGAPCFPFDCVRQKPHASTETRASVGRADAARQGGQKVPPRLRRGAAARDRRGPRGEAARQAARPALCYRMRAFGARARTRAPGQTGNRKRPARAACAAPATVRRLRRAPPRVAHPAFAPLSSRTGRRRDGKRSARIPADARGEPRSPNAGFSAGGGNGRAIHATDAIRQPAGSRPSIAETA